MMMKPGKLYKKKAPKKKREKETKCKDHNSGRQKSPKEVSHTKEREAKEPPQRRVTWRKGNH
jgi:hypothetical protein